jgi:uncharacterized protein YgiM (DUF1202 family)
MTKKVTPEKGVALRKRPYCPYNDSVIQTVTKGTKVVLLNEITYDLLGEKVYQKVRLDSGKEGYILDEALEAI